MYRLLSKTIVFTAPCPYEPYPADASRFWLPGDSNTIMNCTEGMEFVNMGDVCDCLPSGGVPGREYSSSLPQLQTTRCRSQTVPVYPHSGSIILTWNFAWYRPNCICTYSCYHFKNNNKLVYQLLRLTRLYYVVQRHEQLAGYGAQ